VALSLIFNVADFAPVLVGLNVTAITHAQPASRVELQLLVCENIEAFVPVNVRAGDPVKFSNAVPVFPTNIVWALDEVP
jgi:hypothetical protein